MVTHPPTIAGDSASQYAGTGVHRPPRREPWLTGTVRGAKGGAALVALARPG